ncbi:MAG: MFS transporter [Methanobacteriota archaeon]|nr:MAG: MFS transporter [Euryarchaeota archaeon]
MFIIEKSHDNMLKRHSLLFLFLPRGVSAHGGELDTGSEFGPLSGAFVLAGLVIFVGIVVSAIWLIRRKRVEQENPKTYMDKLNMFSRNARLYILHIQGMSLTYGVRTILYNIYLLFVFREGVHLFGWDLDPVYFIGLLLAGGSLVTGLMAPFNGIIVDWLGKKWSFIMGDFIGSITILMVVLIQDPVFVTSMQILRSAVMSIHGIAEGPFIYEQSTAKERVHLFSVASGFSTLASMAGNLAGGVVPLAISVFLYGTPIIEGTASIMVLQVGLFVSVLLWWLSLVPAFPMKEDPELKARGRSHTVKARLSFSNVSNWGTILVFTLNSIFIGTGAGLFVSYFSLFFLLKYSADTASMSMIFAIGSLSVAIGNFLTPILAERLGKVNYLVSTRYLSIVFILLLPMSPLLLVAGIFYVLRIALMAGSFPTESALAMETVNDAERTTMEALRMGGSSVFSAIGFLAGGYFMAVRDFITPFVIAGGLYFVATTIFWFYFRNGTSIESHQSPVVGQ